MARNRSDLAARIMSSRDEDLTLRLRIPLVPTLLGALAVVNILSVVFVLID